MSVRVSRPQLREFTTPVKKVSRLLDPLPVADRRRICVASSFWRPDPRDEEPARSANMAASRQADTAPRRNGALRVPILRVGWAPAQARSTSIEAFGLQLGHWVRNACQHGICQQCAEANLGRVACRLPTRAALLRPRPTQQSPTPCKRRSSSSLAMAGQMARPQFGEFPALMEKVGSQIRPLNLVPDLVVQSPLCLQQTLRVDLRDPVHERRAEAVHRV